MRLTTARKKWLTVFLSLIMPGLGQIYCGELLRGACFLVVFIFSPLLLARITVLLPDGWMLTGMGLALTFGLAGYFAALADSWRLAGAGGRAERGGRGEGQAAAGRPRVPVAGG